MAATSSTLLTTKLTTGENAIADPIRMLAKQHHDDIHSRIVSFVLLFSKSCAIPFHSARHHAFTRAFVRCRDFGECLSMIRCAAIAASSFLAIQPQVFLRSLKDESGGCQGSIPVSRNAAAIISFVERQLFGFVRCRKKEASRVFVVPHRPPSPIADRFRRICFFSIANGLSFQWLKEE